MSGLFAALNAATSALTAHSRSVEIAGKNLANVNNTSYARQRVVYGDRGTIITSTGAESLGLEALGVEQLRDALLDRQVCRETSLTSYYTAQQSAYERAQAALSQDISSASTSSDSSSTSTDSGIAAALDGLFTAFQSLASDPTSTAQRQSLLQSVSILTDRIQLADTRLDQVQADLDTQIETDLDTANTLLATIADLNGQIGSVELNNPGSAVDLRDLRQAALEELSAILPVNYAEDASGQVEVTLNDASSNPVVLVSLATTTGTLSYDRSTTPASIKGGASSTVLSLSSGSVQGALDARDGGVQDLRDELDTLCAQLVTAVNALYNPSGTGANFFDASGVTAGTIALDSSITATTLETGSTGAAGENDIALAIAELASQKFSTTGTPADLIDGTFSTYFANTVSELGQNLSGANTRVEDQTAIEDLVRSERDAVSGVSLDEEMADLMKYQRAFQASSRVFQTIDSLLENIVTELGR